MQENQLSPREGTGSAFGRALRKSMAASGESTRRLAKSYRDLLVRDRKLRRDTRNFMHSRYKLRGSKSESVPTRLFARWCRDENPSKATPAVAWRVFEALAILGVPVTGLDGLLAGGYRRETIAFIGTILGRWQKDQWYDQPDEMAMKRGLGLAAARAVGFVHLVERLTPQQELIASLSAETGWDSRDIWNVLAYGRSIDAMDLTRCSDTREVAAFIEKRRCEWEADLKSRPWFRDEHARISPTERVGEAILSIKYRYDIIQQEGENEVSMRKLAVCREQLTNAWWKWRERENSLQDVLPEYLVAYHALGLNSSVGVRVAQDVLANDEFGFGVGRVTSLLGRQIIDPNFPRFGRILQQMREFSDYGSFPINALAG